MKKNIGIIGSTGSIGKSAISVIKRFKEIFNVKFIVAYSNYKLLAEQAKLINAEAVVILNEKYFKDLVNEFGVFDIKPKIYSGSNLLKELIKASNQSILIANNGIEALDYILCAILSNNDICLANKEALVSAGRIINQNLKSSKSKIIPVDSEHNAIYQIIKDNNDHKEIKQLILTASGGPFYNIDDKDLQNVTSKDTNKHPNWSMGAEICVNSATLVNKALELIEAYYLFNIDKNKIQAIYHPQSLVHGIISYVDSSICMVASPTTMEIPISYALCDTKRLDFKDLSIPVNNFSNMIFEEIKDNKNKAIKLAKQALKEEGNRLCIFNVSNENAVKSFLKGDFSFTNIINVIDYTLNKVEYSEIKTIEDVYIQSKIAKDVSTEYILSLSQ